MDDIGYLDKTTVMGGSGALNDDVYYVVQRVVNATGMIGVCFPRNVKVDPQLEELPPHETNLPRDSLTPFAPAAFCINNAFSLWTLHEDKDTKLVTLGEDERHQACDGFQWVLLHVVFGGHFRNSHFISRMIRGALSLMVGDDVDELDGLMLKAEKAWWARKDITEEAEQFRTILQKNHIPPVYFMNVIMRPSIMYRLGQYNGALTAKKTKATGRGKLALPKTDSSSAVDPHAMDVVIKGNDLLEEPPATGKKRKRAAGPAKPRKKQKKKEEDELPEGSKSPEGFQSPSEIEQALDAVFQNEGI